MKRHRTNAKKETLKEREESGQHVHQPSNTSLDANTTPHGAKWASTQRDMDHCNRFKGYQIGPWFHPENRSVFGRDDAGFPMVKNVLPESWCRPALALAPNELCPNELFNFRPPPT
jgi:hypothetical protein